MTKTSRRVDRRWWWPGIKLGHFDSLSHSLLIMYLSNVVYSNTRHFLREIIDRDDRGSGGEVNEV